MNRLFIVSIAIFFLSPLAKSQNELQTKSVSVFKNNKAFFIKSGTVTPKGNQYQLTGEIPRALFGTLWFQSPSPIKLVSSSEQNIEKTGLPASNFEILKANLNKKVTIYFLPLDMVEGVVMSFSKEYDEETKTYYQPAFVNLKGADKWYSIRIDDIKRIEFTETPVTNVTTFERKKVVTVEFNETKPSQSLSMMYLEDGIGWSPNYMLELTSENKGVLTLQAQVRNDAEDIKGSDVSFVVGVANFKDADKLAWLVDFLPAVSPVYDREGVYDNTALYKSDAQAEASPSTEGDGVEGESAEDLFFYNLKNLTLPKYSRAQLELFRAEVAFEHIYEVRLVDMPVYAIENYVHQNYSTEDKSSKTYHSLKLVNNTKYPWTAGTCFVVNKQNSQNKPISQDKLDYTSMKEENSLRLTESPDIKVEHTEKQIQRRVNIREHREIIYDQITVEAEIKIKNYKSKDVKMNVKRLVLGGLGKSSIDWKKIEKIDYNSSLNKSTEVTWETTVKAGEEMVIKYSYVLIVRGN